MRLEDGSASTLCGREFCGLMEYPVQTPSARKHVNCFMQTYGLEEDIPHNVRGEPVASQWSVSCMVGSSLRPSSNRQHAYNSRHAQCDVGAESFHPKRVCRCDGHRSTIRALSPVAWFLTAAPRALWMC